MKAKQILSVLLSVLIIPAFAQVAGNANYQFQVNLPTHQINVPYPNSDEFVLSIKGLSNVKADKYIAIFSLNQAAETAEAVNTLIDGRIKPIQEYCDTKDDCSLYVDMISFVPMYELDLVKKIFNKKTYNEVPVGFEVKKNIHIQYRNPNDLNKIIEICSRSEIYDLVRVDYFSDSLEEKKTELMNMAREAIERKLKNKAFILNVDFGDYTKQMSDGYTVVYPIEMYTKYNAVSCNQFAMQQKQEVNKAEKSSTHYYKPYFDKDFDFTVNPVIFEPVIQVLYEVKVKYTPKKEEAKEVIKEVEKIVKETQVQKEVVIITPAGEMKTVKLLCD